MKRFAWCAAFALAVAGSAHAQGGAYPYSVYGGQTVGYNSNVVVGRAGWPGLSVGILHGITDSVDIGGTLTFNYGVEGITDNPQAGLRAAFNSRFRLLDQGKFDLGLHIDPAFIIYFYGNTHPGIAIPVGLSAGIPLASSFLLHFAFDVPLFFIFGDPGSFTGLPFLAGGGFEYFIDQQLSVNFTLRLGPTILITSNASTTQFTLYALFGVGYKL
jgi:hypothetical protein